MPAVRVGEPRNMLNQVELNHQPIVSLFDSISGPSCSWWWSGKSKERPYKDDSTASRLLSEVKHLLARLVLVAYYGGPR
eukprot:scaffold38302_cov42-Attheya_sp.AAC.2